MKKILYNLSIPLLLLIAMSGCYKRIDTPNNRSNSLVLAYPAVNSYTIASSGANYFKNALLDFDMSKASVTVPVSINLPKAQSSDVVVTLGIDQAAFDAYNADTSHSTKYTMMPASYYSLPAATITLPAGKTDTTVLLTFYPASIDLSLGYLLPLTITNATNSQVSQSLKTIYFHIEKDPFPPYSRTGWNVVSFNSQEASGEGPNNGRVIFMFDNNPSTFWHSKWQGGTDPLPYWFIIDMNASNIVHGINILPRQGVSSNSGRPKTITFEVSTDGTTWTNATNINVADNANWQKFVFSTATPAARYFRATVTTVYGGVSYANLAEFKVF
ncbi:MAG: DUF1735 domain-containing protein [Bacteroidetes bacterium]|nr:DUF1735 domain-containing protein [Bacteroidota bacterium]